MTTRVTVVAAVLASLALGGVAVAATAKAKAKAQPVARRVYPLGLLSDSPVVGSHAADNLFDDDLAANVRYGMLDATEQEIRDSAAALGLADWLDGLPHGLATQVGQRGESLSAGERQLVALLRAHLADPDLLVLDEATSAVDPQLEMRIGRALEHLMTGRTSVTIAHRLSTAEQADDIAILAVRYGQRSAEIIQQNGPAVAIGLAVLALVAGVAYYRLGRQGVSASRSGRSDTSNGR